MKFPFSLFLLFYTTSSFAQLSFPKGFKRIKGENLTGIEDIYSNGRYSFQARNLAPNNESEWNDKKFQKFLSEDFGFPFYQTKDSLLWGTGKVGDYYSYIVVDWGGQAYD